MMVKYCPSRSGHVTGSGSTNWGNVGTAYIYDNGAIRNYDNTHISVVHVNGNDSPFVSVGGELRNWGNATIGTVFLNSGTVSNIGRIDNLTYTGGTYYGGQVLDNHYRWQTGTGTIGTLTIAGDSAASDWGNVGTANINSGTLTNRISRTITSATMNSGAVTNAGTISNLTYNGGTYTWSGNGSIGSLTLAGDSTRTDWGIVENLKFADNGSGMLTISAATADNMLIAPAMMDFQLFSTDLPNISFSGIQVTDSVNLANAWISLDMSAFGMYGDDLLDSFFATYGENVFSFANLFGTDNVTNWDALTYFELAYGNGSAMTLFDGNQWLAGWGIGEFGITNAAIPEPATLAIIGLGLAGLGLARRRRQGK